MDLTEKLKMPACSKWNELAKIKPERFQFVLVNTQYCRYPAQTACWNGMEFRSTDNGRYKNITHWAEINDLGQKILPYHEDDKIKALRISIDQIQSSFDVIRSFNYGSVEDDLSLIFESIGSDTSHLEMIYKHLLNPPKDNE